MKTFDQYTFKPFVEKTIKDCHFVSPTEIQSTVIPLVYKHRDVIGVSQTGTGKTHAFLIPVMDLIDTSNPCVQAVITTPTRELASQIYEASKCFMKNNPELKVSLIIGGNDKQKSISKLSTQPHIVIGTPGRIKDLSLNEQALQITTADIFVMDEADMTIEFGYLEDVDALLAKMKDNLQMLVFSATIPQMLRPFLNKYMNAPKLVEIDAHLTTNTNVKHYLIPTKHQDRLMVLEKLIHIIDPYICIIFANSRVEVSSIAHELREKGFKIGEIHGNLEPRERKQMMRRITNNEYQFIVATDIAARGIDIDGVSHIINYDLPKETDFYIHRSGRCGRGKYTGECYNLYDTSNQQMIELLEKKGISFSVKKIKGDELVDDDRTHKRKNRVKPTSTIESQIAATVRMPKKVKPGYKKKRQRQIDKMVRMKKRELIRADIKRQKKERAKAAQIEKNRMNEE